MKDPALPAHFREELAYQIILRFLGSLKSQSLTAL